MRDITTTRSLTVDAPREAVFDWFVGLDLAEIMRGYGPLAAVAGTSAQTGPWDRPGSQRAIHLADGHALRQRVLACDRPARFRYRIDGFPGALGRLVEEAVSEWRFEDAGGATRIEWRYTHRGRTVVGTLLLLPAVRLLWAGYMGRIIDAVKRGAEAACRVTGPATRADPP